MTGRTAKDTVEAVPADDSKFHKCTHTQAGFRRVPQGLVEMESVRIAPSDPAPLQVASLFEVADDNLYSPLGDLAGGGDRTLSCIRRSGEGQQHPGVTGHERPLPVSPVVHRPQCLSTPPRSLKVTTTRC